MTMRICLMLIFFGAMGVLRGQHHHYMFIQADQQQPFYVKMGAELLSSSKDGFLIVPRLKDSAYEMIIGFPEKKYPEYRFRFAGFRKDRGMALKNFQEKGWGLFDYQSMEVQMGEKQEQPVPIAHEPIPSPLTNDPFTVILAGVIGDPGLLATPLISTGAGTGVTATNAVVRTAVEKPAALPEKNLTNGGILGDPKDVSLNDSALTGADLIFTKARPAMDSADLASKGKLPEHAAGADSTQRVTANNLPVNDTTQRTASPSVVSIPQAAATPASTQDSGLLTSTSVEAKEAQSAGIEQTRSTEATLETRSSSDPQATSSATTPAASGKNKRPLGGLFAGGILKRDKKKETSSRTEVPSPPIAEAPVSTPESKKQETSAESSPEIMAAAPAQTSLVPVSIRLHEEKQEDSGVRRIYVDATSMGQPDTVEVWIPVEAQKASGEKTLVNETVGEKEISKKTEDEKGNANEAIGGKEISREAPAVQVGTGKSGGAITDSVTETSTRKPNRSDCLRKASSTDIKALRKKMVGIRDEDEMVMVALRDIKQRCYTTDQVRDLCAVFTRDEGRYKLIDAAYRYVYDPSRYESLEFLLSDKYFIHRFRALIQN